MQIASNDYRESIKKPNRNRGYIKAKIGIISKDAEDVAFLSDKNSLAKFSLSYIPDSTENKRVYATMEENFSKVDGSMYFMPAENNSYYRNSLVPSEILGKVCIAFSKTPLDIKGLTIDFGEEYPIEFLVDYGVGTKTFVNGSRIFITEEVFYNVTKMDIIPVKMLGGNQRLRIYSLLFGITKSFTNNEVLNYSFTDYVSPISETIPNQDMELTVDNQDQYYNADNPESAFSFLDVGQKMEVSIGYDVSGNGDIEWLQPNVCYLKTWSATDTDAKFVASDIFDYNNGTYHKGLYYENGISLYDLAKDVLEDMGIEPESYFIDPYLRKVLVYNPIPVVTHKEALQIIANAGRCTLCIDRKRGICIRASFVPEMVVSSNSETPYSDSVNILNTEKDDFYAEMSENFSKVDGSMYFMPENENYIGTGYVSEYVSKADGTFQTNPKLVITMDAGFVPQNIGISFVSIIPKEFVVRGSYQGDIVKELLVNGFGEEWVTDWDFSEIDKLEFEFTKNTPNARIFVKRVLIGTYPNEKIERDDMTSSPTSERQNKIKSIGVKMYIPKMSGETQEFSSGEVKLSGDKAEEEIILSQPYKNVSVSVENDEITASLETIGSYVYKISLSGNVPDGTSVKYSLSGNEIKLEEYIMEESYNYSGEAKIWGNPIVTDEAHASKLLDWVSQHFLGDIEYKVSWRGNPASDAGDVFSLEVKNIGMTPVKAYESKFGFDGAFSGEIRGRKIFL